MTHPKMRLQESLFDYLVMFRDPKQWTESIQIVFRIPDNPDKWGDMDSNSRRLIRTMRIICYPGRDAIFIRLKQHPYLRNG